MSRLSIYLAVRLKAFSLIVVQAIWPLRVLVVILVVPIVLSSCVSSPETAESLSAGQIPGDLGKCANPEHQALPECYCHALSLTRHPERIESCEPPSSMKGQAGSAYSPGSCDNPAIKMESLSTLAERKVAFCSLSGNWDKSSCYCYAPVVEQNLERAGFCHSVERSRLRIDLAEHGFRSVNWVQALRERTYWTEQTVSDLTEVWSDNSDEYLNYLPVKDDCDAVDSLLGLAFALGGFEMFELAKVIVDTNLNDDVLADHYVGALWASGRWYYIEAGSDAVRPLSDLGYEGLLDTNPDFSHSSKIVAYRKLDQSEWYQGGPPSLDLLANYCPVPAELLFSGLG